MDNLSPFPVEVTVTRKARFSSAHYYYLDEYSPEENRALFKSCSNRHGHGHNYEVEVAVKGPIDPETGMVVNLKDLKAILEETVVTPLDHQNLNLDVAYFSTHLPTLENMALFLWEELHPRFTSLSLHLDWIKVTENADLFVEYFGEPLSAKEITAA